MYYILHSDISLVANKVMIVVTIEHVILARHFYFIIIGRHPNINRCILLLV